MFTHLCSYSYKAHKVQRKKEDKDCLQMDMEQPGIMRAKERKYRTQIVVAFSD
jgi:hypothetical protein